MNNISIDYDEILITVPGASGDNLRRIIDICKLSGKTFKTVPSLNEMINKDVTLQSIRNVSYLDLLGRDEVQLDTNAIENFIKGKRILISGAGGSIGAELVRQCLESKQINNNIEVSLKCRIGLGKNFNYDFFEEFISEIEKSEIKIIYVHARNAILNGISPKGNRTIPPLNYDFV